MITFDISGLNSGRPPQGDCLSTDEKPITGIRNGTVLYEMDTGDIYKFDAENARWLKQ